MEYICEDAGRSKWYYEKGTYIRVYADGRKGPSVKQEFIPDPEALLAAKIDMAVANGQKPDVEALRPSKAIYALWEHKQTLDKE